MKFDDILPNAGLTFRPWDNQHVLSVVRGRPVGAAHGQPVLGAPPAGRQRRPADAGVRNHQGVRPRLAPATAARTIASVALYHIDYTNRIVSSFDPDLGFSVDRNVGDVKIQGFDAQLGQRFGELRST